MERNTGLSSRAAFWKASGPHGYQSTGLLACWRRYGAFSLVRRFAFLISLSGMVKKHSSYKYSIEIVILSDSLSRSYHTLLIIEENNLFFSCSVVANDHFSKNILTCCCNSSAVKICLPLISRSKFLIWLFKFAISISYFPLYLR